jgi:transposase-like protein
MAETLVAQGSERMGGPGERIETALIRPSDDRSEGPREEWGRLSNPAQRRLSPVDVDDLIATYRAGATIRHVAAEFGIHRTTVAAHLDRHQIPRHREQTAWESGTLEEAAALYASGLSLADVADQFGIDAQTVANRLRRAGVAVRPRRGRPSPPV